MQIPSARDMLPPEQCMYAPQGSGADDGSALVGTARACQLRCDKAVSRGPCLRPAPLHSADADSLRCRSEALSIAVRLASQLHCSGASARAVMQEACMDAMLCNLVHYAVGVGCTTPGARVGGRVVPKLQAPMLASLQVPMGFAHVQGLVQT